MGGFVLNGWLSFSAGFVWGFRLSFCVGFFFFWIKCVGVLGLHGGDRGDEWYFILYMYY